MDTWRLQLWRDLSGAAASLNKAKKGKGPVKITPKLVAQLQKDLEEVRARAKGVGLSQTDIETYEKTNPPAVD